MKIDFQTLCVWLLVNGAILYYVLERLTEWEEHDAKYQRMKEKNAELRWKVRDLEKTVKKLKNEERETDTL